ncbi:cuticle protein 1 [Zootermopsis nevadensis]|uniref:cuticle protein 1 n=1 Tax=Zootermopsis nevadensis TaxID=136037 RepID=UPI000B8E90F5|nr:cuticle protein 1 [Zootermopsis nevadensis]XP_021915348.1 cuticle protein 1 [Zootermopsis nevadensis]
MFYKLVLFAAVAMVQAERYPAGLNPGLCPNYPYCNSAASFHYAPHAASAAHNYAPHAAAAAHNYAPHAAAAAHNYPAGVSPASCPNYPYCSHHVPVGPLPGYHARQYPAGVSAVTCPNYPYCH